MKLRLLYFFTIFFLLLSFDLPLKSQNPTKNSVLQNKDESIQVNCDSIYKNSDYKIILTPISYRQNEVNYKFVFKLMKTSNSKPHEIYKDTIFSTVQEIDFQDFNGDGIKDILIQNSSDVRSNWTYNLYLVDLKNNTLKKIKGFNDIKNPKYLKKYNLIDNYVHSGKNWTSLYKIKGDSVVDLGVLIYDNQTENGSYQRELKDAIEKIIKNEKTTANTGS